MESIAINEKSKALLGQIINAVIMESPRVRECIMSMKTAMNVPENYTFDLVSGVFSAPIKTPDKKPE
jgi:hypothetical protein